MSSQHLDDKLISWASILEENTRDQAIRSSKLPFIYPHIALMPDAHWGMGATVGSVIPTQGAIIPAAVGVDIGCGMIAHRTQFTTDVLVNVKRSVLREAIEKVIPLSAGKYNENFWDWHTEDTAAELALRARNANFDPQTYAANWKMQLGSLGSGNHFIEVTVDQEDRVWLFLHSGSRGVGNKIASFHIKRARAAMDRWFIDLPDPDLAYLAEGTDEFWQYIREMRWAQEFALANREEMMRRLTNCFENWIEEKVNPELEINCHHNYTTQEKHFGREVWLTRKGAIDAHEGVWGLIPGSMGTASYAVQGKGNHVALHSSPHGAGRNGSRKWARSAFSFEELKRNMEGIEWRESEAFLDEIPGAYKPIDLVMEDAADLVEVKYELKQILNVKGT